jgi:rubrerythrin
MTVLRMTQFIDMAIKDEVSGEAFYKAFAEITGNAELKAAYEKIAEQEHHHMESFKKMKEAVSDTTIPEEYAGQYEAYLNSFLATRAFPGVEAALHMEKDTLLMYHELRDFIPSTHQAFVKQIMDEERQHIATLTNLKERFAR